MKNSYLPPTGHNTREVDNISVVGEESPALETITTVGEADGNSWWNSQIHKLEDGHEFCIQFGTFSKEAYDKVAKACAEIMDKEYHAKKL